MPRHLLKERVEKFVILRLDQPVSVAGPYIAKLCISSFLEQRMEPFFGYQIADKVSTPKQHIVGYHFYPLLGSLYF